MLKAFVQESKAQFLGLEQHSNVIFVLGNTSADVDSVVSALVLAFILRFVTKSKEFFYVPLINTSPKVLSGKLDVKRVLETENIAIDDLVFYSETKEIQQVANSYFFLVDHNTLSEDQTDISGKVVGVIDHHTKSNNFDESKLKVNIIGKSASALTLILDYYSTALEQSGLASLRRLLLSPLYLDSILFSEDQFNKRYFDIDIKIRDQLKSKVVLEAKEDEKFFEELLKLRNEATSLGSMRLDDLLFADLKTFSHGSTNYGISSMFGTLEDWEKVKSPGETLKSFCVSQKLNIHFLILFDPQTSTRHLIAYNNGFQNFNKLVSDLVSKEIVSHSSHGKPKKTSSMLSSLKKKISSKKRISNPSVLHVNSQNGTRKFLQPLISSSLEK